MEKGREKVPRGLLGISYQLFLGASFPLVLHLAPTCVAGVSLLLGAGAIRDCPRVSVVRAG